jgi:hypothetical protein
MSIRFQILSLVLTLAFAGTVRAQVADPAPGPVLAYEGRLTESNLLVTGSRPFVFSILDAKGNELWNSGPQTITVAEGLYGVVLGSTGMPAIPTSVTLKANLKLHVLADGAAIAPDIALVPALQASTSWNVTGPFLGDISGTQQGITVDKLKGIPISAIPTAGQVLTFNGTSWTPSTATAATGTPGPAGPTGPPGPPGVQGSAGGSPFLYDSGNAVFFNGSLGIGIDPPDPTALLDLTSNAKGLLAPRMTGPQRQAIASPANGLIVFDTDAKALEVYDAVGAVWNSIGTGNGTVTGVTGTSPVTVTGTTAPVVSLGTVPVSSGGTGATSLSGYVFGAGSSALTAYTTIPGTAITGSISGKAAGVNGIVPVANGGTGNTTGYSVNVTGVVPVANGGTGNTTGYAINVTGIVPVANGGTGVTRFDGGNGVLTGNFGGPIQDSSTIAIFGTTLGINGGYVSGYPLYVTNISSILNNDPHKTFTQVNAVGAFAINSPIATNFTTDIYATDDIAAAAFVAFSDARIKNVIGLSDNASDLATLRQIKITDYRYIDVLGKGNSPRKGVIAQELEKVYPAAVGITSDFIPNVYALAQNVSYNAARQELTLTLPKAHGLAVGDMVRVMADTGTIEEPVAFVGGDDTFVLSGVSKATNKAFVYGKKVDDFHSVDYDQLFSMNIGATQQLAAENDALKTQVVALTNRLAALEQAVAGLHAPK